MSAPTVLSPATAPGRGALRSNCLNFWELLAQAIALISPTMTAALIVPLMFGTTHNLSWLAYAFGTLMLLLVSLNINQFAKRSTSAGSMYAYTSRGLGPSAGAISGWCLIWAYQSIGIAGLTGFTVMGINLLQMAGVNTDAHPVVLALALFAACGAAVWFFAWRDIQFSTLLMLVLEGISMFFIVALCVVVLGKHHFALDRSQLNVREMFSSTDNFKNMGLGVVVAVFSLVGFECATAFGEEAKNPLRTIPRAVIASLLITGLFFVFITYVEVMDLRDNATPLDQLTAPLNTMAELAHVKWMAPVVTTGALLSFFSLALSCVNAGSRILFAMGRHGIFPKGTAKSHARNETPHVAIAVVTAVLLVVPTAVLLSGHVHPDRWSVAVLDIFGWAGVMGAFGFVAAYFLISVAAPMYLKKEGQLRPLDVALSVAAVVCLIVPAVGSVWPVPAFPVNDFIWIFLAYLLVGVAWVLAFRFRLPERIEEIRRELEASHAIAGTKVVVPDNGSLIATPTIA